LTKDGTEDFISKLDEYENKGDVNVLKNTTFTCKRTFIGYGIENKSKYDGLVSVDDYKHIVYTDRTTVKPEMIPLDKTQMLGQVQGECNVNPITKKWQLTSSFLPCACPSCRVNPSGFNTSCSYKDIRQPKQIDIKMKGEIVNKYPDDIFGYQVLTCDQLKEELNGRGVLTPRRLNKGELLVLLTGVVEDEYANDNDGEKVDDGDDEVGEEDLHEDETLLIN